MRKALRKITFHQRVKHKQYKNRCTHWYMHDGRCYWCGRYRLW